MPQQIKDIEELKAVRAAVGTEFTIMLPRDGAGRWHYALDTGKVEFRKQDYIPSKTSMQYGFDVFTFLAKEPGESTIMMEYSEWGAASNKTRDIKVVLLSPLPEKREE